MASTEDAGVPIAEVSRVLGVPMSTLRSWERRYDLPARTRPLGTHRRYSPSELHGLRLMRDEIARGKRAHLAAGSVRDLLALSGRTTDLVNGILEASQRSDPIAVRGHLDTGLDVLGLARCLDEVLLPAMQQIGLWWATGRCDVDQEHLTTESARAWLETLTSRAPPPTKRNPIVLACGPSDLHTIGLEALAVLLRHDGRACRMLGARTDTAALLTAIYANDADSVVVVSHLSSGRQRAIGSIRAAGGSGASVFYAGNAFVSPRSRRNLPGTYLGTGLDAARRLITGELTATRSEHEAVTAGPVRVVAEPRGSGDSTPGRGPGPASG